MSDIKAAATVLTDERIDRAIMKSALFDNAFPTNDALHDFARWIEREVLAQAGVTAEPEGLAQSEKPHDLTIREAFDAVGGWMNGGEMGYPSFGSFEALSIYTTKMIRCFFGNKAWHERNDAQVPAAEVRAQALEEAAEVTERCYAKSVFSFELGTEAAARIRSLAHQSTADKASEVRAAGDAEYELHQDDMMVAATSGKNAYAEIQHFANQYVQDGPVEIFKVVRTSIERHAIPSSRTADSANTGALGGKGAEA